MNSREERFRSASLDSSRRLVLELHEFEVSGNQIQVWYVGLADDLGDRNRIFVADRIVERAARIRRIAEREIAREGSNVVRFQPGKEPR